MSDDDRLIQQAALPKWARDVGLAELSSEDLREMAQGCTELSCMYHGHINQELRRRAFAAAKEQWGDGDE